MAKLIWRVKLVAEFETGETTEVEVARIERDEQAGLSDLGLRLAEAKQLTSALQAEIVPAQVTIAGEHRCTCAACGRRLASKGHFTATFRSLFGETKHGETKHGATKHGAAAKHEAGTPSLDEDHDCRPHLHGLSHRDVVVAGPPCGDGQAYTSLLDLTLLTGATIVAAPVPLIEAAMRTYKGTAAIVPRDAHVGGLAPGRVFAVA